MKSVHGKAFRALFIIGLVVLCFFWVLPIIWVVVNSFRTNLEFFTAYSVFSGPLDYLQHMFPYQWTTETYVQLFTGEGINGSVDMLRMISNSLIVTGSSTIIVLIITSMAAFGYERLRFPNGEKIFWALFLLSLFPNTVSIIPLYKICYALGWINNLNALIWPCVTVVMNILMQRNFMKSIPRELDEAACIDGASSLQTYLYVILPCMKPVLMVVGLFAFKASWNDYLWPCIAMTGARSLTLTAGLRYLHSQLESSYQATLQAATVLSILFPLAIYFFTQDYFLKGINVSASVKG